MSGFAIQSFCTSLVRPVVKVQVRAMPKGSWRWQDACRIQLVRCPANQSPDLRRRGHELVSVIGHKLPRGTRATKATIAQAQHYADQHNSYAA